MHNFHGSFSLIIQISFHVSLEVVFEGPHPWHTFFQLFIYQMGVLNTVQVGTLAVDGCGQETDTSRRQSLKAELIERRRKGRGREREMERGLFRE